MNAFKLLVCLIIVTVVAVTLGQPGCPHENIPQVCAFLAADLIARSVHPTGLRKDKLPGGTGKRSASLDLQSPGSLMRDEHSIK